MTSNSLVADHSVTVSPRILLSACCLAMVSIGFAANTSALCLTAIADEFVLDSARSGLFLSCAFWGLVLSISLAGHVGHACLGAAITGLGTGIVDALLTPLACSAYPKARAWTANLLHAFYPIGIFLLVLIVVALTQMGWTWRGIYRFIAATNAPYAIIFLAGVTELGPSQWLPAYLAQAAGGTRTASALGLLLLGGMMALGRLGNSFLARHVSPWRLVVAGSTLSAVFLVLAALPAGTLFTVCCLGLLGLAFSGLWPTILSLAGNRFPRAGASMYSLLHTSGNLGGLVGPLTIGLVAQRTSLRLAMAALAVVPLFILGLRALDRKAPPEA